MNKMPRYDDWRAANSPLPFSMFDYAHGVLREAKVSGDVVVALASLVWRMFIEVEQLVFLAEEYSEEKAQALSRRGVTGPDLEYWMNLFSVDGFFQNIAGTEEDEERLASLLVQSWTAKLSIEFSTQVSCGGSGQGRRCWGPLRSV